MNVLSVKECVRAGYSAVVIQSAEEKRALQECLKIAKECKKELYLWTCTKGFEKIISSKEGEEENFYSQSEDDDCIDPQDALSNSLNLNEKKGDYIVCLLDFHHYIDRPAVLRSAKDTFEEANGLGICLVFISNQFNIPIDWEDVVVSINLNLPNKEELKDCLWNMVDMCRNQLEINNENEIESLVDKAAEITLGLTMTQAENAFATSFSKKGTIDLQIISEVKAQIICKNGLLEFYNVDNNIQVGGMNTLKNYTKKRILAYSEDAQKYGLPFPKGILLVGIPGCGKSLAAKALAQTWNVPLIKCDLGKFFGSYVGDTETNTRKALETADAMSPCVLWIDEIEKALGGVGSGGKNDSGVSSRMFATVLTWMQEKKSSVYVIATANSITSLPQELLRKGRFDEIFFVDLPNKKEREEIIKIQIKKKGRKPEKFEIDKISEQSEGFTGAEIEEAVISALFDSYADNARELESSDIIKSINNIKPASKGIMKATVEQLQEWAKNRGIPNANNNDEVEETLENITTPKKKSGRKFLV